MVGLTKGLAATVAPVRVNLVSPGAVDTELWDKIFGGRGMRYASTFLRTLNFICRHRERNRSWRSMKGAKADARIVNSRLKGRRRGLEGRWR